MCRLFGMLAAQPATGEVWLVRSERSLLHQSNVSPEAVQKDGWGIAWFDDGGRVRVERGVGGAYEDGEKPRFVRTAESARSSLVVGHLRHASNPMNLPREKLIGPENSQPFTTHSVVFAHNGAIPFPTETRPYLGVHAPEVRGVNDSEVLFRLLLRHTEEIGDPLRAYSRTVEDLLRVWEEVGAPTPSAYSGLNVLFARQPNELWAFCQSLGDHGGSLCDPGRPYYTMTFHAEPHRLIVASEPFDRTPGRWTDLPNGQFLHAERADGKVTVRTGPIPLPAARVLAPTAR